LPNNTPADEDKSATEDGRIAKGEQGPASSPQKDQEGALGGEEYAAEQGGCWKG
jgi:hypothetical protein